MNLSRYFKILFLWLISSVFTHGDEAVAPAVSAVKLKHGFNAVHWAVGQAIPPAETKIPVWNIKRLDKKD